MPQIQRYQAQRTLLTTEQPRLSAAAVAAPYEAGAELGEVGQNIGLHFARKQKEAAQADELSRNTTSAAVEFQDLSAGLERQENFETILTDYEDRVRDMRSKYAEQIKDPEVRTAFNTDFARMYLVKRESLREHQTRKRLDYMRSGLVESMEQYKDLIVNASGRHADQEISGHLGRFQDHVESLVAAGAVKAEEGITLFNTFKDTVAQAQVERQIMENPRRVYMDIAGGGYEHLAEEDRVKWLKAARAEWTYRLDVDEKFNAGAEKLIKQRREDNTLDMLVALSKGELDQNRLNAAGTNREISSTQFTSLYKLLVNPRSKKSVDTVYLGHVEAIDGGAGDPDTILFDARSGLLSIPDTMKLLDRKKTRDKDYQTGQGKHRKWAVDHLKARIITTGPGAMMRRNDEEAALSGALDELDQRIEAEKLTGRQVRQAAIEVADAWATIPLGPGAVRKIRGVRPKDAAHIEELRKSIIFDLFENRIDADTAEQDIMNLELYDHIFKRAAEGKNAGAAELARRKAMK